MTTDRSAIEALARELDHETPAQWARRVAPVLPWDGPTIGDYVIGWVAVFDAWEHDDYRGVWWTSEECRALLAYLDEVWAGLKPSRRDCLLACVRGDITVLNPHAVAALVAEGLLQREEETFAGCSVYDATPRGRALVRRTQETGGAK